MLVCSSPMDGVSQDMTESAEIRKQSYREAYDRWQRDLQRLHRVLLDGEPLDPMHRVALIRAESHSYDRYHQARQTFFGLGSGGEHPSPFFAEDEAEGEGNA